MRTGYGEYSIDDGKLKPVFEVEATKKKPAPNQGNENKEVEKKNEVVYKARIEIFVRHHDLIIASEGAGSLIVNYKGKDESRRVKLQWRPSPEDGEFHYLKVLPSGECLYRYQEELRSFRMDVIAKVLDTDAPGIIPKIVTLVKEVRFFEVFPGRDIVYINKEYQLQRYGREVPDAKPFSAQIKAMYKFENYLFTAYGSGIGCYNFNTLVKLDYISNYVEGAGDYPYTPNSDRALTVFRYRHTIHGITMYNNTGSLGVFVLLRGSTLFMVGSYKIGDNLKKMKGIVQVGSKLRFIVFGEQNIHSLAIL